MRCHRVIHYSSIYASHLHSIFMHYGFFIHLFSVLKCVVYLIIYFTIQKLWHVRATLVRMEQLVLITMVVVAMPVSVLLALREQSVKMVYSLTFTSCNVYVKCLSSFSWHVIRVIHYTSIYASCLFSCIMGSSQLLLNYLMYLLLYLEILACASNPCQNGATCFDHNGGSGYVCLCPAGFEGTNCENGTHCFLLYHYPGFNFQYNVSFIDRPSPTIYAAYKNLSWNILLQRSYISIITLYTLQKK